MMDKKLEQAFNSLKNDFERIGNLENEFYNIKNATFFSETSKGCKM